MMREAKARLLIGKRADFRILRSNTPRNRQIERMSSMMVFVWCDSNGVRPQIFDGFDMQHEVESKGVSAGL